jgi:hypothetical protein
VIRPEIVCSHERAKHGVPAVFGETRTQYLREHLPILDARGATMSIPMLVGAKVTLGANESSTDEE